MKMGGEVWNVEQSEGRWKGDKIWSVKKDEIKFFKKES